MDKDEMLLTKNKVLIIIKTDVAKQIIQNNDFKTNNSEKEGSIVFEVSCGDEAG